MATLVISVLSLAVVGGTVSGKVVAVNDSCTVFYYFFRMNYNHNSAQFPCIFGFSESFSNSHSCAMHWILCILYL